MSTQLPPTPDFEAVEAIAPRSAARRTRLLALLGNLAFSWSNNESLLIYVVMLLLRTDQASAAVVFATLNTTRARLDLIQRLAKLHIRDRAHHKSLAALIDRFSECTRLRNEFNHCMYTVDHRGEITHTQSMRIVETRASLRFGEVKPIDAARIEEIAKVIQEFKKINREVWALLPRLEIHLKRSRQLNSPAENAAPTR